MKQNMRYFLVVFAWLIVMPLSAQTNLWRDIHKVKKGETVFSIAKEYDVTIDDILAANPEMKEPGYELKKGSWVFVPFSKKGDKTSKEERMVIPAKTIKVGVMLPLHNVNGDGNRMVEYYRGILMACNELRREGINTEIYAWNVPEEVDIRTTLLEKEADKMDVIFGPLYTKMVQPLSGFCKTYNIKMVIPFSINGNDVTENPNIFQVYQSPGEIYGRMISAFIERFPNHHTIFIDCVDPTSDKGAYTKALREQLDGMGVKYNLTSINTDGADFAKAFSVNQPNVIVINSPKSPQLNAVFAKLDALKRVNPGLAISLYGYTEWLMYQKYDLDNFFKYNAYIPTTFYYNAVADRTEKFERDYFQAFKRPMMEALPRFAITGYDHAMYFIHGINDYGKKFTGEAKQSTYKPLQTKLKFERVGAGGYKNAQFQLIHFLNNQTMEAITY